MEETAPSPVKAVPPPLPPATPTTAVTAVSEAPARTTKRPTPAAPKEEEDEFVSVPTETQQNRSSNNPIHESPTKPSRNVPPPPEEVEVEDTSPDVRSKENQATIKSKCFVCH